MAELSGRAIAVLLGLTFCSGILVGWKLKAWRVQYLNAKRGFLASKLRETQDKINVATGQCCKLHADMEGEEFGPRVLDHFLLRKGVVFLNHGSYGAIPKEVFNARVKLLEETEDEPDLFFRSNLEKYWKENLVAISQVLGSNPDNLVFVNNTTTGINAIMKSLPLQSGDGILCYSWQYGAVYQTCLHVARQRGAEVLSVDIRTPIYSAQEVIDKYDEFLSKHPAVKVAVLDYISSVPSVLMPVKDLINVCKKYGVLVVIDGAHVPGQVQVNLEDLGADFFAGNLHKWMFVPRGCAVLWVNPKHHETIYPTVISKYFDHPKISFKFVMQGTYDATPFFSTQKSLEYIESMGGLRSIIDHNTKLADEAADLLVELLGTKKFEIPKEMESPYLRMVRLPDLKKYPARKEDPLNRNTTFGDIPQLTMDLLSRFNIQSIALYAHGEPWIRLSLQIYNNLDDVRKLADAILTLKSEEDQ